MAWFSKPRYSTLPSKQKASDKNRSDKDLWKKCVSCKKVVYNKKWNENKKVCPHCGFHDRMSARERINLLADEGTFKETDANLVSVDPLNFVDAKESYKLKIKGAEAKSNEKEAIITGSCKIEGQGVELAVMDFNYMGGSMGSVVGEKICRSIDRAIRSKNSLIIVSCSGGARMHEGLFSLMQMAKTSASLSRLGKEHLPFISILTNPTTGGVTASFASIGDIIIAEPEALIGFAGPRVIEQTIRQKLPTGFQRSEFLQDHGFVDMIVKRDDLKSNVAKVLNMLLN